MALFSHPDYTVGPGFQPGQPLSSRTCGWHTMPPITAGEEFHLALNNCWRKYIKLTDKYRYNS
jgi:hypothetical protein